MPIYWICLYPEASSYTILKTFKLPQPEYCLGRWGKKNAPLSRPVPLRPQGDIICGPSSHSGFIKNYFPSNFRRMEPPPPPCSHYSHCSHCSQCSHLRQCSHCSHCSHFSHCSHYSNWSHRSHCVVTVVILVIVIEAPGFANLLWRETHGSLSPLCFKTSIVIWEGVKKNGFIWDFVPNYG